MDAEREYGMVEAATKAYAERNFLVALLARLFPAGTTKTDIPGWDKAWHGCVYIDLPTGQVSWHFHESEAYMFAGLPTYTKPWDGHDSVEKYRRVIEYFSTLDAAHDRRRAD